MSDPFYGEIRVIAFTYPPRNWAFCYGQILSVQQNAALFSILGINFGGNGTTNFGLPDLRGRAAGGVSPSTLLSDTVGSATVALGATEIPAHSHLVNEIDSFDATYRTETPTSNQTSLASTATNLQTQGNNKIYSDQTANVTLSPKSIGPQTTTVTAHENMQPYLAMNFVIALQGVFPTRN